MCALVYGSWLGAVRLSGNEAFVPAGHTGVPRGGGAVVTFRKTRE
jgi:hypothetical protein